MICVVPGRGLQAAARGTATSGTGDSPHSRKAIQGAVQAQGQDCACSATGRRGAGAHRRPKQGLQLLFTFQVSYCSPHSSDAELRAENFWRNKDPGPELQSTGSTLAVQELISQTKRSTDCLLLSFRVRNSLTSKGCCRGTWDFEGGSSCLTTVG